MLGDRRGSRRGLGCSSTEYREASRLPEGRGVGSVRFDAPRSKRLPDRSTYRLFVVFLDSLEDFKTIFGCLDGV